MADCHDLFQTYLGEIRLHAQKKTSLRTSRDANRGRIRKYFRETLQKEAPKFHGQGSIAMHTGVNPLDGDYDVDDGVYLQGLGTDQSTWPTAQAVHGWIVDAVKGYTSVPPKDKARCVRVRYGGDYHVDLPIYALNAVGTPLLFEKGKVPSESDPRACTQWFRDAVRSAAQIRRLVRYFKGWRDQQSSNGSTASGLALTILTVNHHRPDVRDDVALVNTARAMHAHLNAGGGVHKPVTPFEDLAARWSDTQRERFVSKLANFRDRGQDALDEEDKSVASGIWQKLLGDRFPKVEPPPSAKSQSSIRTSAPAILGNDGRSA